MIDNLSPYYSTKVTDSGYLDILKPRPIPIAKDDVVFEITAPYRHRPDLLAYDMYGSSKLWWIFAQRNPDIIKDSIYDFEPGTKIYLPQAKYLRERLGL